MQQRDKRPAPSTIPSTPAPDSPAPKQIAGKAQRTLRQRRLATPSIYAFHHVDKPAHLFLREKVASKPQTTAPTRDRLQGPKRLPPTYVSPLGQDEETLRTSVSRHHPGRRKTRKRTSRQAVRSKRQSTHRFPITDASRTKKTDTPNNQPKQNSVCFHTGHTSPVNPGASGDSASGGRNPLTREEVPTSTSPLRSLSRNLLPTQQEAKRNTHNTNQCLPRPTAGLLPHYPPKQALTSKHRHFWRGKGANSLHTREPPKPPPPRPKSARKGGGRRLPPKDLQR